MDKIKIPNGNGMYSFVRLALTRLMQGHAQRMAESYSVTDPT